MDAAKKANVHETIMKLPKGHKMQVLERRVMISGREKQRLAVARVFLKDECRGPNVTARGDNHWKILTALSSVM